MPKIYIQFPNKTTNPLLEGGGFVSIKDSLYIIRKNVYAAHQHAVFL